MLFAHLNLNNATGGMRCAFPPYALRNTLQCRTIRQAVDVEVAVQSEYATSTKTLGRSNQRSIGQIHGSVSVLVHQHSHSIHLVPGQVMQDKSSCGPQSLQLRLSSISASLEDEIHHLSETRPGGHQWSGGQPFRCIDARCMIRVILIDKGDQGASVSEGHKRPRRCFSTSPWAKRWPQFSDNASGAPLTVPT